MSHAARLHARRMIRARLRTLLGSLVLAVVFTVVLSKIVRADDTPRLKAEVVVTDEIVRLGDLIENAGSVADRAVFRSPDVGTTGQVEAWRVVDIARQAGLSRVDAQGLRAIKVSRAGQEIRSEDIRALVLAALASRQPGLSVATTDVVFDRDPGTLVADATITNPMKVNTLNINDTTGRFDAAITLSGVAGQRELRLRGQMRAMVDVAVLSRAVERGQVIVPADFTLVRRPRDEVAAQRPLEADKLAGLAARRALRAGQVANVADFESPRLVSRGDAVTIVLERPGLMLAIRGQALADGAKGDTINIMNQQSKRVVQAIVVAPGRVAIAPPPRLATNVEAVQ
jgi:flagella basal body P-ring formation protein FlgA